MRQSYCFYVFIVNKFIYFSVWLGFNFETWIMTSMFVAGFGFVIWGCWVCIIFLSFLPVHSAVKFSEGTIVKPVLKYPDLFTITNI